MSIHTKNNQIIKVDDELIPLIGAFNDTNIITTHNYENEINSAIEAVQIIYNLTDLINEFNEASRSTDLDLEYQEINKKYSNLLNLIEVSRGAYNLLKVKDQFIEDIKSIKQPYGYYNYIKTNIVNDHIAYLTKSYFLFKWSINCGLLILKKETIINVVCYLSDIEIFKYIVKIMKLNKSDIISILKFVMNSDDTRYYDIIDYIQDTYFEKNITHFDSDIELFETWLEKNKFIEQ